MEDLKEPGLCTIERELSKSSHHADNINQKHFCSNIQTTSLSTTVVH
jgi:hypothetical protein